MPDAAFPGEADDARSDRHRQAEYPMENKKRRLSDMERARHFGRTTHSRSSSEGVIADWACSARVTGSAAATTARVVQTSTRRALVHRARPRRDPLEIVATTIDQ